jgi:urea transport system substrate-binding protein
MTPRHRSSSLLAAGISVFLSMIVGMTEQALEHAWAAEPIKVGILHSLSGTMAISETPIKEVVLMAIDEIN